MTWYERLIGAVGVLLLLFSIQHYLGALAGLWVAATYIFLAGFSLF